MQQDEKKDQKIEQEAIIQVAVGQNKKTSSNTSLKGSKQISQFEPHILSYILFSTSMKFNSKISKLNSIQRLLCSCSTSQRYLDSNVLIQEVSTKEIHPLNRIDNLNFNTLLDQWKITIIDKDFSSAQLVMILHLEKAIWTCTMNQ